MVDQYRHLAGLITVGQPVALEPGDTAAAVRFLSCEPLLGPLPSLDLTGIDWVIIGAESGHGARSMDNDWALEIIEKADAAGCAVFVKQLSGGAHAIKDMEQFPLTNLRRREYIRRALSAAFPIDIDNYLGAEQQ